MDKLLHFFITKCCLLQSHNLEDCAKVPKEYGELVRQQDIAEQFFHVEFNVDGDETLHLIYRKRDWLIATERRRQEQLRAEKDRQEAILRREQEALLEGQKSTALLEASNKLKKIGKTDREVENTLELCLSGELPELAEKLQLSKFCKVKKVRTIESLKAAFED